MKRNILSKAVVLLVMVAMVVSTIPAVTAETDKNAAAADAWMKQMLHPDENVKSLAERSPMPEGTVKIKAQGARPFDPESTLAGELVDQYFGYDSDYFDNAYTIGDPGGTVGMGIMVDSLEWAAYSAWDDIEIETIQYYYGTPDYMPTGVVGNGPHDGQILIYQQTTPPVSTDIPIFTQSFSTGTADVGWREVTLSTPLLVDPLLQYYIGVEFEVAGDTANLEYPCGLDNTGPTTFDKSMFMFYEVDGGTIQDWLYYASTYGNAHVRLGLTELSGPTAGCDLALEITDPDDGETNSLPQTVDILVKNFGLDAIEEAKILLDIWQEIPGPCNIIWEEDFEDLDGVAANWSVFDGNLDDDTWFIDGPCGSVNRSHSGDYSYRSTAGNQRPPCPGQGSDTYLANADDTLCLDNPVDMSGLAWGTISFWHWAQGENGDVLQDYGTVSVSNGLFSVDIPASYFAAYDNGWQQYVIGVGDVPSTADVDIIVGFDLTDEMSICFNWQADPHMCYEGWYIDDVVFEGCADPSYTLVFQSHLIVEDIPAEEFEGIPFSFPLSFTPQNGATYKVQVCGQVFKPAGCDTNPENDCDIVWITINDVCDVASIETTGPIHIDACEPAEFEVTVQNTGTFPQDEVPVTLEVAKIITEQDFDGFEGMGWESFGTNDMTHISNCDPYEGNNCLAFTQDTCDEPHYKPYSFSFAYKPVLYDFSGDNIVGASMKYAARWSLSGQVGSVSYYGYYDPIPPVDPTGNVDFYDHWFIALIDWETGYYVPCTADDFNAVYAGDLSYNEYWESYCAPGQHAGMFEVDLMQLTDDINAYNGLFANKQVGIGFAFVSNDDEYILHLDQPDFSGLLIDNVIVETVFTDEANYVQVDEDVTGYLPVGGMETLTMQWNETCNFCDYSVAGITHLDCGNGQDDVPENDISSTQTRITTSWEDDLEFDSIDNTGGPSLWHCVDDCAPNDNYMWAGDDATGLYVTMMDDGLTSPVIDLSAHTVGQLEFETWYDLEAGWDFGEVQYSTNGQSWTTIISFTGESAGWELITATVPASSTLQIRFRMVSDITVVDNGWYVDDVVVKGVSAPTSIDVDFEMGIPMDWTQTQYSGSGVWEASTTAYTSPPGSGVFAVADSDGNSGVSYDVELFTPIIDLSGETSVDFSCGENFQDLGFDDMAGIYVYSDGSYEETLYESIGVDDPYGGSILSTTIDPSMYGAPDKVQIGFYYMTTGTWEWGFGIDDVVLNSVKDEVVVFEDNFDDCGADWDKATVEGGDWWTTVDYAADPFTPSAPPCDDDGVAIWNGDPSTGGYYTGSSVDNEYITEIDLSETPEGEEYTSVDLSFATWYDFGGFYYVEQWSGTYNQFILARGTVEISTDYGETWNILRDYTFSSGGWIDEVINLDCYIPNVIQLRFYFTCVGEDGVPSYVGGEEAFLGGDGWYIDCIEIDYKHEILEDDTPPVTTCWIAGDPYIVLDAIDPVDPDSGISSGVCATYYILDGGDVEEYTEPFQVTGDGDHEIEFWSIDCWDPPNEENPKTKTFTVDTTPPTVSIDEPGEGLYLFGSKTIALSGKIIAIGKLPITVSASDAISGVDFISLEFTGAAEDTAFIDGDSGTYVFNDRAFGEVTVTATAQDMQGLQSSSETLTFKIYCLGLF